MNNGATHGWRRTLDGGVYAWRRTTYLLLVLLTSVGAMVLLRASYTSGGLTLLKLLLLILYAILILWIAVSFWSATLGFLVLFTRFDYFARRRVAVAEQSGPLPADGRTAILMPIYSEDPDRVFAAIRAIARSLEKTAHADHFDFFILSDTRDVDT